MEYQGCVKSRAGTFASASMGGRHERGRLAASLQQPSSERATHEETQQQSYLPVSTDRHHQAVLVTVAASKVAVD